MDALHKGSSETRTSGSVALLRILERRGADGNPVYSPVQVRHALAVLLLPTLEAGSMDGLPPSLVAMLGEFAILAGVTPGLSITHAKQKVMAFLEQFPPEPGLWRELKQFVREYLGAGPDMARQLSRLLGTEPTLTRVLDQGTRPPGTIAANPLARFTLKGK